ncbi:neuronal membrane glycoprotein M6-b-like [Asterias amurensis]|uniref:neuronal membrane glycoprotein M6-b-like n=1 Tax=Asterias amurensis TaxID=7602 RepID=UPI003AB3AAA8
MAEGGCCDCALCRCLKRVPYGTLFAILLLAGGLALLTYETLTIRYVAQEMFIKAQVNVNSVLYEGTGTLFWVLISAVAVMGIFGFLLLVFACLTSGPSGQNTCGQERTRCIGMCSTDILIMVTYGVCAIWIALTVVLAMPFTFMLMVRSYCKTVTPTSCIDLSHYGLTAKVAKTSATSNVTDLSVCGASLTGFCDKNGSIWLSSFLAMTACILIVIALIHFLMALSANHTYQKMLSGDQPTRTKYGNDYRRAYGDADIPLQEPLNIHDESTRF